MVAVLVGLGFWGWRVFFPGPEQAIRKRIAALAQSASFSPPQGSLALALNSQKLANFCAPDVQISVDIPGLMQHTFSGRDQVRDVALAARANLSALSVEFVDLNVSVGPDKLSAVVNLTAKARVPGEREVLPQELKFLLRKTSGDWFINRVETVKTLL
jgi:hypothetical protein